MAPASELCDGCFRTLDEIAAWSAMDDDGKRGVWQRLVKRASDAKTDDQPRPKSAAAPGTHA